MKFIAFTLGLIFSQIAFIQAQDEKLEYVDSGEIVPKEKVESNIIQLNAMYLLREAVWRSGQCIEQDSVACVISRDTSNLINQTIPFTTRVFCRSSSVKGLFADLVNVEDTSSFNVVDVSQDAFNAGNEILRLSNDNDKFTEDSSNVFKIIFLKGAKETGFQLSFDTSDRLIRTVKIFNEPFKQVGNYSSRYTTKYNYQQGELISEDFEFIEIYLLGGHNIQMTTTGTQFYENGKMIKTASCAKENNETIDCNTTAMEYESERLVRMIDLPMSSGLVTATYTYHDDTIVITVAADCENELMRGLKIVYSGLDFN